MKDLGHNTLGRIKMMIGAVAQVKTAQMRNQKKPNLNRSTIIKHQPKL